MAAQSARQSSPTAALPFPLLLLLEAAGPQRCSRGASRTCASTARSSSSLGGLLNVVELLGAQAGCSQTSNTGQAQSELLRSQLSSPHAVRGMAGHSMSWGKPLGACQRADDLLAVRSGRPCRVEQLLAEGPQHHVRPLRDEQDVAARAICRHRLAVPARPALT